MEGRPTDGLASADPIRQSFVGFEGFSHLITWKARSSASDEDGGDSARLLVRKRTIWYENEPYGTKTDHLVRKRTRTDTICPVDFSSPYSVLLSDSIGSLLAVLAKVTRPLSGRELERMSGVKHPTALRALGRLTEHGLVTVDEAGAGAALLYTLNRDHVAADAALILVGLNRRLREQLTQEVSGWSPAPKHVSMFGSAARGDGGVSSDVDLLIVRPSGIDQEAVEWREQLDRLPRLVLAWTGNHAGIIEISEEEAGQMALSNPRVLGELKRDAITIHGFPVSALFEA